MHAHLHFGFERQHEGFLTRVGRDVALALDWLAGPAMSACDRQNRLRAEVSNDRFSVGIF